MSLCISKIGDLIHWIHSGGIQYIKMNGTRIIGSIGIVQFGESCMRIYYFLFQAQPLPPAAAAAAAVRETKY